MKRILIAIAVLAVTVLSSQAADVGAPDMNRTTPDVKASQPDMKGTMKHGMHRGMPKEMMRNPQHLLVMAYHKNVLTFGHMLEMAARQGETVPREVARTAIAEMRRSTEEMEKYRAAAMRDMPADMKDHGDMKKKMDQHLIEVKTHLRQLEDLAKNDRIQSQEVLKHLQFLKECEGMGCGNGMQGGKMHHDGMMHHDEKMHRDGHGKGMHGCQCECECAKCGGMDEDEDED